MSKGGEFHVIAPADKGNITWVMDFSEYERKIQTLLDDTGMYRRLMKDPTVAQERKINGLLLTLMRSGAISERLYQQLRSSAEKVPLLYGLPKVHKPGTPLRPIVSFCQLSHIRPVKASGRYPLPLGWQIPFTCQEFV